MRHKILDAGKWSIVWSLSSAALALSLFTVYITVTGSPQVEANPDIAAWWPFEEGSGNSTEDISQNNNTAFLMPSCPDCPAWAQGMRGGALEFDGANDYAEAPDSPPLNISDNLTIELWIYPDNITGFSTLLSKGSPFNGSILNYGLQFHDGLPRLRFFSMDAGGYDFADSSVDIATGQWSHVAVTFSGGSLDFYINGTLTDSLAYPEALLPATNYSLFIGKHNHATLGDSQFFDGRMDNIRIWKRSLTPGEVAGLYSKGGA